MKRVADRHAVAHMLRTLSFQERVLSSREKAALRLTTSQSTSDGGPVDFGSLGRPVRTPRLRLVNTCSGATDHLCVTRCSRLRAWVKMPQQLHVADAHIPKLLNRGESVNPQQRRTRKWDYLGDRRRQGGSGHYGRDGVVPR